MRHRKRCEFKDERKGLAVSLCPRRGKRWFFKMRSKMRNQVRSNGLFVLLNGEKNMELSKT